MYSHMMTVINLQQTLELNSHLVFIQKHQPYNHDVDVPTYCPILEKTGDLGGTQTYTVMDC